MVSADFALSFFYFMSGFIVMFALIKKYQRAPEDPNNEFEKQQVPPSQRRISFFDEGMPLQDCETMAIPKLNKRAMVKQVLARWLRLAFPTYIIVFFTLFMFQTLGSGPVFTNAITNTLIIPLQTSWWGILLFIQNVHPWNQ